MTNQLSRVNLSIASPSQIEHTARQLRAIREGFLTTGSLAPLTPRTMILESWQRCQAMRVNPARRCAPLAIARESQLHQLREASEVLIRAARSVLAWLTDFLADSGYVVVLSDAKGRLLYVAGDEGIRRRLERIDFIPGGNWSEAAAGTNAIGTALADGHLVQLMGAEHYCDGWQDLTCTATPIRHPFTGEMIGVLDVTGDYRLIRSFLINSLAAAALEIQQEMRTLLHGTSQGEAQMKLQAAHLISSAGLPFELDNLNEIQWHTTSEELPVTLTVDDMRLRLDVQQRRAHDAERLAAAAGAISASLDLDIALEKVAEQAAHLFNIDRAGVFLFDETSDSMSLHMWCRQNPSWPESLRGLKGLLEQSKAASLIRERGEPVIIDDVLSSTFLPASVIELTGIRSLALLPLLTARGIIGFIAVPKFLVYHWIINDVRIGLAFAAQSATAIENARLFDVLQQHNRRIEVLNAIAQLLNTLPDPNQHLDLILKRIMEIMELEAGMVLHLDQNIDSLTLVAHRGFPEAVSLDVCALPLKPLYEVAFLVAAMGESLLICSEEGQEHLIHETLRAMGIFNLMVVPLAASQTILGVLLLGSRNQQVLTGEDRALFTSIGQQLGLALRNAQLLRSASEMEALREADRVKSGFLAGVSHDLRSPLTAIRASVESLLDRENVQSTPDQEHLLQNIAGQAGRLGRLVDQLLDLSRIEAGAFSLDRDWTELPVLITDTIAKFEELNSRYKVEHDLQEDLPLHYVDPNYLTQVLWNLLENACKYGPSSSRILVDARWNGTDVLIGVADRGPGIPAGEREQIFQRFYRLYRDHRSHTAGSGLGLAICRGIVEAHGGQIWVEDRIGGGSVFRISLPLPTEAPIELDTMESLNCAV
jgi:signal transduction histidine kinase